MTKELTLYCSERRKLDRLMNQHGLVSSVSSSLEKIHVNLFIAFKHATKYMRKWLGYGRKKEGQMFFYSVM
jgi:hypothetical protein